MRGRYQLLATRNWGFSDSFEDLREKARQARMKDLEMFASLAPHEWIVRDCETGAIYDLNLAKVLEPDSRRADLVDHAKDTLLWPYRGPRDE